MRCDNCGSDIPTGQEVETTRSEQTGSPGITGASTRTVTVTLCPGCAKSQDQFWNIVMIVAVSAGLFFLLAAIFGWW